MGALFICSKKTQFLCAAYADLMRGLCAGGGLSLQILRWGQGPLLFQTPLNQNATFDLEHEAPDRDFFIPLSIKTLLLNLEHGAPDHYFFLPLSIKTLLLTSSTGLHTMTFPYPSPSKRYF